MAYLFYGYSGTNTALAHSAPTVAATFLIEVWRPTLIHLKPNNFSLLPYFVWSLFWMFRVFRDPGYAIYIVRDKKSGQVVHRSHVFPRWFRFPFMKPGDLQIGDTFTEPDYRGNKLAEIALSRIVSDLSQNGRTLWYVVHEENAASIRVAEKCGLQCLGKGDRYKRLGSRLFGSYRIEQP